MDWKIQYYNDVSSPNWIQSNLSQNPNSLGVCLCVFNLTHSLT